MRAKFILDLSEAQWELYPEQSPYDANGNPIPENEGKEHAEWIVDLPDGPWVQFTYGGLRDHNGGEVFGDLYFGQDTGFFHHDKRVFSDLVIEFLPDEEVVYVLAWTGGYEDPAVVVKKTLEAAEATGREWRDQISKKELDEVRLLKADLTADTIETVVSYWWSDDENAIVEKR